MKKKKTRAREERAAKKAAADQAAETADASPAKQARPAARKQRPGAPSPASESKRAEIAIWLCLLLPLGYFFLRAVSNSMSWPMHHDLPIMMYAGLLMDRFGFLPYRDFFDMNMPGSYLIYFLIGKLFGYTDSALRWADLFALSGVLAPTVAVLRRIDYRVGAVAAVLFTLAYLGFGPYMTLQRELLVLAPVLLGVWAAVSQPASSNRRRLLLTGIAFGLAASIKPHALLGLIPVGVYLWSDPRVERQGSPPFLRARAVEAAIGLGGVALPLLVCLLALVLMGTLGDFLSVLGGYLPLYGSLDKWHRTIENPERWKYLIDQLYTLGGHGYLAVAAAVGVASYLMLARAETEKRRLVLLIVGMTIAYALYPMLSGQFWKYHWFPLLYWLVVCISLLAAVLPPELSLHKRLLPIAVLVWVVFGMVEPHRGFRPLGRQYPPNDRGQPQAIAEFLQQNLQAGDTVQPLDWTATGAVHALLIARAEIATPFIYDFHFYHHVSTDYIQGLRRRLIAGLEQSRPRFVIRGKKGPFPKGEDTSLRFAELDRFLADGYRLAVDNSAYAIFERR